MSLSVRDTDTGFSFVALFFLRSRGILGGANARYFCGVEDWS